MEAFANGDWSQRDIVEHWALGPVTKHSVIKRFQKLFVWAVASGAPKVFPRHRWTGAEDSMRWILVLMSCHGLLARVFKVFAGKAFVAAADGGGADDGGGAIDPANQQLELAMADQDAANAVPDLKQRWTAAVSSWKRNALAWVSDDEALPQLLLFRYVHEGHRAMMTDMLTMSGSKWARTQA